MSGGSIELLPYNCSINYIGVNISDETCFAHPIKPLQRAIRGIISSYT